MARIIDAEYKNLIGDKVKEIRNQTLQLYFLILGGCTISDADFAKLGIETTT